jgi:hypothetical protein
MGKILLAIAALWGIALAATRSDIEGAGGSFDCGSDCSGLQDLINAVIFVAPLLFALILIAGLIGSRTGRPKD